MRPLALALVRGCLPKLGEFTAKRLNLFHQPWRTLLLEFELPHLFPVADDHHR